MSSLYNLEPQPTAKVVLKTTSGDILLELFAKQTPFTCRNFLQLCLDGYYDNTIFHRLVPGFVIQGGDPTGTGEGGEAIYDGGRFADEFHSRLKFNRRGLLGTANAGRKDDNGSQFFLTLGKTAELDGRNTMFGRVVGDTIYNLMKMGDAELVGGEGSERPLYPTKIVETEVLVNPFEDMVRREVKGKTMVGEEKAGVKKPKKKATKLLLSFEGEEGEEAEASQVVKKAKFNTKLIGGDTNGVGGGNAESKALSKQTAKPLRRRSSECPSPAPKAKPDPATQLPLPNDEEPSRSPSTSPEPVEMGKVSSLLDRTNAQIAELKASMKRNIPASPVESGRKRSALEQMIPENAMRGRKRKHGANGDAASDSQALSILNAFRAKLEKAPFETKPEASPIREDGSGNATSNGNGNADGDDDEEAHLCDLHFIANCQSCQSWDKHSADAAEAQDDDGKGWMSHALSFEKDRLGKDLNWKRKNEEELVVIDPREKAKDIKEGQRAKKMAKGGSSGTAWGKDRDRGRVPDRKAGERG
ncbi:MAG: cyclophilin [Lasallia pustulata]|uniref:Cyclophilin n=1 Tax=Lasallia pustulata TaxID=136370 RepID=A0A5M8PLF8_9LECA|nr:MAG: cyclophilin [Lasallia pustulata]